MQKPSPSSARQTLSPELVKLIELEASEGIESFRWLATQLIHVATVLSVANLTAVGYAFTNNQAGILLLGAGITLFLLTAYRGGFKGAVPLLCRLVALERLTTSMLMFSLDENVLDRPITETGISVVLLNVLGSEFLDEVDEVNGVMGRAEKRKAMRKLEKRMVTHFPTRRGVFLLWLAVLIQIASVPLLVFVFHWRFL